MTPAQFELTGEVRKVQPGEWYLTEKGGAQQAGFSGTLLPFGVRKILRPVKGEA